MNSEIVLIYIIVAFSFALILIMKRDSLPERLKRPLAILASLLVAFAFFLIVYGFFTA